MSDLVTAMTTLFTFLIAQMTSIATFFVTSTIGQVILAVSLFSLIVYLIIYIIDRIRG